MKNLFTNIKKNLISASIVALLGVMTMVDTAKAADYNWRFANLYGRGTAFGELYKDLAADIEKRTDGKIKVQVLFSGEGVGTSGLLGAAKSGLITMAAPFQSMHAGELPAGVLIMQKNYINFFMKMDLVMF